MTYNREIFDENIMRVDSLCKMYSDMKDKNQNPSSKTFQQTDILRAAVVFLHSSFEEYFRSILIEWLPEKAEDDVFNNIPLPSNKELKSKKKEKFQLNDLLAFKSETVNEVLKEAVNQRMELVSFNKYGDICTWSKNCSISLLGFSQGDTIEKCVQRRHKIVHEADIDKGKDGTKSILSGIKDTTVLKWKNAYIELADTIDKQITEWVSEKTEM